jgi:hypothetical protein
MPNHCVCSDTGGVPGEPSYTPHRPAPGIRSWVCRAPVGAVSQSVSPRSLVPNRGGVAARRVSDRVSDSGDRPARVGRRPRLCARARGRGAVPVAGAEISAGADARRRVNRCVALGGDRRGISTDPRCELGSALGRGAQLTYSQVSVSTVARTSNSSLNSALATIE